MIALQDVEVVLVSSGHTALDHRVFDKEAVSLARHFPRVRVVAAHPRDEVRDQVSIIGLPAGTHRFDRFLLRPWRCLWAARGPGARVLILHDAELLWLVPLIKLTTGWRVIYDVHEDFAQLLLRRAWIPRKLRRSLSHGVGLVEKAFAACCDGIIGVTEVLVERFAHRPHVALYNLPSGDFIRQAAACAQPLAARRYDLVHLGTLSVERVAFLGEVMRGLFARRPEARVLLIGVRPEHRAAFDAFPPERVTVLGAVPYADIAGLLADCRIGIDVHPVLYPHLRCAVPVKVFEYMAAGCNVVTSFLPELHRLLSGEGHGHVTTITTADAERFADGVHRLLESPEVMQQHQDALMRLVAAHWNWETEEKKLVRFVTSIITRKEITVDGQVPDCQR